MAERYEKIDENNLRVIVESEHTVTKETLLDIVANLEIEKQKIQTDIDNIKTRLTILDEE